MLNWLKNITKEYPDFWKNYLLQFESKSNRYVVLYLEKSGLNPTKDRILSMGCFGIENNRLALGDHFEIEINTDDNEATLKINDLYLTDSVEKTDESEAIQRLIDYIGNAILIGYRIENDVAMINEALEKLDCGRLKNEPLDLEIMHLRVVDENNKSFSLDELCHIYKVPINERNLASDQAFKMGLLFLKLKSKLGI